MVNDLRKSDLQKIPWNTSHAEKILENIRSIESTKTIYLTEVTKDISENDIKNKLIVYEGIKEIFFLTENKCTFIDFVSSNQAEHFMNYFENGFKINKIELEMYYSHLSIDHFKTLLNINTKRTRNKVLHCCVDNATFPITVDILKKICSNHGKVMKVLISPKNEKNQVEALIELENIIDAKCVKENLDGNEIYKDCCHLTVRFSCLYSLIIDKNDSESYEIVDKIKAHMLESPIESSSTVASLPKKQPNQSQDCPLNLEDDKSTKLKPKRQAFLVYEGDPTCRETGEGVVLKISNFHPKLKTNNIFNWFCLFGNVTRIHKDSETTAFVQMANLEGASFCRYMLNGATAYNMKMEIKMTDLPDINGMEPFTDYSTHTHNRFRTKLQAGKPFRVYSPSQTVHFFNVPESYRAESIAKVLSKLGAPDPEKVVVFPKKNAPPDSASGSGNNSNESQQHHIVSGLIEYNTVHEALEAICMANHSPLSRNNSRSSGASNIKNNICHMRIVFSPVRISEEQAQKVAAISNTSNTNTSPDSSSSNNSTLPGGANNNGQDVNRKRPNFQEISRKDNKKPKNH